MRAIVLIVSLVATAAGAEPDNVSMNLACVGGGTANRVTSGTVNAWDNNGNFASGTVTGHRSVGFDDQVNLVIEGSEGRIRMPRSMLPLIHGGQDGWFKLKNIEMTDGEIRASAAINAINNPKVRLDRYSGAISVSGKAGDFTGRCRKFDPATTQRQF